jgi:hypothetical protein
LAGAGLAHTAVQPFLSTDACLPLLLVLLPLLLLLLL